MRFKTCTKVLRTAIVIQLGKRQKKWATALISTGCSLLDDTAKSELRRFLSFAGTESGDDANYDDEVMARQVMLLRMMAIKVTAKKLMMGQVMVLKVMAMKVMMGLVMVLKVMAIEVMTMQVSDCVESDGDEGHGDEIQGV